VRAINAAAAGDSPYTPPKADGAVAELLDEDIEPLFPHLVGEVSNLTPTITREDRDVFAGVEATRVTPLQKYQANLPGWAFKIVEKPAAAGEFRYLRFAWKKIGGTGVMIQFYSPEKSWFRYFAARNVMGREPATEVAPKLPGDWTLVTRDLFTELGAITLNGIALSPFDGDAALYDHVLLGRSVADLDRATDQALGKVKPAKALAGKERDDHWADLMGADGKKAAAALRAFLATAPDHVTFLRERLADVPDARRAARVRELLAKLDADDFDTREEATDELVKLGPSVIDAVREAQTGDNDEVRYRCRVILKKLGASTEGNPVSRSARQSRAIRVLERADSAEARDVLAEIARGKLAPELAADAKAALARLGKP
jgi:hypothetical protein